jgi:hypothetical protein
MVAERNRSEVSNNGICEQKAKKIFIIRDIKIGKVATPFISGACF